MKYRVQHGLPNTDRVRTVVDRAYEAYKERLAKYDPSITWQGDDRAVISFAIMGKKLDANVEIDERELRLDGKVPFLFRPFEGKILGVVGGEVEKWIEKAKKGEI